MSPSIMSTAWGRLRRPFRAGMTALLFLSVASSSAWTGSAAAAADPLAKVEPRARAQAAASADTTFWAILRDKADISRAPAIRNRAARGKFVLDELRRAADRSQGGLRALLTKRGTNFTPFWIINAIKITADEAVLKQVAARPEVERILADRTYQLPAPQPGTVESAVDAIEWNIDRVGAPQVWSTFGDRGENIVVANIDSGVQYNHPALVAQYRGNLGGGTFDHNYNWFDPSRVCGSPSLVPCDNNGHGTHTMGTMVGDDGNPGANQIGVAPRARWIAAKGCETNNCSTAALLASGQWMLAPTDLDGQNPRADLRPHIVNNSWGGGGNDPFYQATVNAWIASGIFPSFSNGNAGPGCATARVSRRLPEQLQRRGVRHQQRHRQLLQPWLLGLRRRGQAEHRRARRQRAQQRAHERVRRLQRHVHGRPARLRHGRTDVGGGTRPRTRHRRDQGTT